MVFYPSGAQVPEQLSTSEFLLRPLRTTDVELDYAAVMESAAMLRRWGGSSWPPDDFTLEGNLADLAQHEQEHQLRMAFTYTMMNLSESECLGCVYINSLAELFCLANSEELKTQSAGSSQAIVRFWTRQSRLSDDLDRRLLQALMEWFQDDWAFDRLYFRANDNDERQKSLMAQVGLPRRYTLDVPGRYGPFLGFGPLGSAGKREA